MLRIISLLSTLVFDQVWTMINYSKLSLNAIAHDLWECTNIIKAHSKYEALHLIQNQTELTYGQCEIVYRLMIKLESRLTY